LPRADPIQLVPGNSLFPEPPEEGRRLAIKMARLIIKATPPDVATEFATIAAANRYWNA